MGLAAALEIHFRWIVHQYSELHPTNAVIPAGSAHSSVLAHHAAPWWPRQMQRDLRLVVVDALDAVRCNLGGRWYRGEKKRAC